MGLTITLFLVLITIIKRYNFILNNAWNKFIYHIIKIINLELEINLNRNKSGNFSHIIMCLYIAILFTGILSFFPYIYPITSNIALTVGFAYMIIMGCMLLSLYF